MITMTKPLKAWFESEGRLLRLRLSRPKANLIDSAMIASLDEALTEHLDTPSLVAVLIDAEGQNFSYGASVEEHLPGQCELMLKDIHALILRLAGAPVTVLVAIRGQCLGGGMELALAGHLLFVNPDARLGQPEMKLGVFAPAASCLLPEVVGPVRALDLLLSGRSISGTKAFEIGIAHEVAEDPERAALTYFEEHLKQKSASSLRYALRAARLDYLTRLKAKLESVEHIYLDGLMKTHDAVEGLEAFIGKRPAQWQHR
jgi:cyclohexa-1,5-dienecarbonyl-CoA hydratase